MISILIPVYREAELLDSLLKDLLNDSFKEKEIIVTIDEPTEDSKEIIKKHGSVKFIVNKKRIGKAKALNNAVKKSSGDILLFLDSDVVIKTKKFLTKIADGIKGCDILDIKKSVIDDSKMSKVSNYEFMTTSFLTYFFSKMERCLGLNGSGFAIRRSVFDELGSFKENIVSEDLELGIQSYLKNKKYKLAKDVEISTEVKSNWKEWLVQRKRWGVGGGQFFRMHWREMLKAMLKHTHITLMILFMSWPLLFTSLLFNTGFENLLLVTLFTVSLKFSILFPIFLFTGFGFLFLKNMVVFLMTYGVSSVMFFIVSKKLDFSYSFKYYTLYYFFYSPFWFMIFIYNFAKGLLYRRIDIKLSDWKI